MVFSNRMVCLYRRRRSPGVTLACGVRRGIFPFGGFVFRIWWGVGTVTTVADRTKLEKSGVLRIFRHPQTGVIWTVVVREVKPGIAGDDMRVPPNAMKHGVAAVSPITGRKDLPGKPIKE